MTEEQYLENIFPLLHQAILNPHLSLETLYEICDASIDNNFGGLCTSPIFLSSARKRIGTKKTTKLISVISFPFGFVPCELKFAEAEFSASEGADELDLVPNFQALKANNFDLFAEEIAKVCSLGLPVRIILNIKDIDKELLHIAIDALIDAGAQGLQNGNGFGPSVSETEISQLSQIVRGRCEIKAAGGIKTLNHATKLVKAGAKIIGTSFGPELISESRVSLK